MTKILTEDNDGHKIIRGVETPYGIIKTNVVLNAAGVWSGTIAQMVGLSIPLTPMKHAYIVTEPMNVQGLPNIRDPDRSIYFRVQGGTLSIGGYESNLYKGTRRLLLQFIRTELGCIQCTCRSDERIDTHFGNHRNKDNSVRSRKFYS